METLALCSIKKNVASQMSGNPLVNKPTRFGYKMSSVLTEEDCIISFMCYPNFCSDVIPVQTVKSCILMTEANNATIDNIRNSWKRKNAAEKP